MDVYTLDYSTGISASSPVWNYSPTGLTTLLQPYERGVAFGTTKNVIYAQGGLSTTDTVRKMVTYTPTSPSSGSWAARNI